ncbi:unnamed protein product [Blumeria hordei]|nr:unnamed protein product [Blumeria hordei]
MSGNSNVGNSQIYEANEQRNISQATAIQEKKNARYDEGKQNSHKLNDSKDQQSIANKLAHETKNQKVNDKGQCSEVEQLKIDPTLPATLHNNKPSKGAKIDAEIQAEEQEELRRKGKA